MPQVSPSVRRLRAAPLDERTRRLAQEAVVPMVGAAR
jgi:hypothetical protein